MVTCPHCGLERLPARARFCPRCGAPLGMVALPAGAEPQAPIWVLILLWLGAAGLLWIAIIYLFFALGAIPRDTIVGSADVASLRAGSALVAAVSASLSAAHAVAAVGLMSGRSWARTFTTLVCVTWALTCVGVPVAVLAIGALWRRRGGSPVASRPSP